MPTRVVLAVSVGWALALSGSAASAADCSPPGWLKTVEVKQTTQDAVGAGKAEDAVLARREAKKAIGAKLTKPRLADILALPSVRDAVNRKVYSKDDLLKATSLAVGLNVRTPKKLAESVVCKTTYVALSANVKAVLGQLKQNKNLGDEINAALLGKIDAEFEKVEAEEQVAADAAFALPEQALKRLNAAADALGDGDLMRAEMQRLIRKKALKLKDGLDQKAKVARLEDEARDGEKLIAAAKEMKKKNYVALFEMLSARATYGEEESQFLVGYMYSEAMGVKRDDEEALAMLKRSASKNYGPAKALIGVMTYSGRGTKADQQEAVRWLESAQNDGWTCEVQLNQCKR